MNANDKRTARNQRLIVARLKAHFVVCWPIKLFIRYLFSYCRAYLNENSIEIAHKRRSDSIHRVKF